MPNRKQDPETENVIADYDQEIRYLQDLGNEIRSRDSVMMEMLIKVEGRDVEALRKLDEEGLGFPASLVPQTPYISLGSLNDDSGWDDPSWSTTMIHQKTPVTK
jgi:hypothetical protein